ncbi:MAG: Amidophosphoribosyltransferase precursor [Firmicutes bacterium ADurb.Bin193]|nr:MAG: Amidophosphoribosyltransferase precursor [Firmicutes bacterium ADurb.Bin193]
MDGILKEECGLMGVYNFNNHNDAANIIYYGLYALQHRGQECCGIAVNDDGTIVHHKDMGLVFEVFNDTMLNHLKGTIGVGHVRYSTTGSIMRENAQPLVTKYKKGTLTVAHNGNIVNAAELRREFENNGAIFQTTSDSEVIAYIIARERIKCHSIEEAIARAMGYLRGSYSIVVMSPRKLIAARDPWGIRPLSFGKTDHSYIFASETCALDAVDAEFIRDIKPGEIVCIDKDGVRTDERLCSGKGNICIFEYIYFARPDSVVEGISVYDARWRAGKYLAIEHPVDADIVIPVPDSGIDAAIGYAEQSGIPYGIGLIKNRYIGRTFIQPTQQQRVRAVRIKLNALKETIKGKRVVMVDDSIVRGTTSQRIVQMIRDAGATEVHMRISCPPFLYPCYFGTDIPSQESLIAVNHTVEETCKMIGADSLGYLSLENLSKILGDTYKGHCNACFTGKYPMEVPFNAKGGAC